MEKKRTEKMHFINSTCMGGENCREGLTLSLRGDRFTIVFFFGQKHKPYIFIYYYYHIITVYVYTNYYVVVIDDGLHALPTNGTTHIVVVVLFISKTRV